MDKKIKILFFHFDMKGGGAEKVLVNLVNSLDHEKYDITVKTIFGVGPHIANLAPHIRYQYVFKHQFRGFSKIQKLFSPKLLHKLLIHDKYDLEIAYLETCPTRIISGCPHADTKKMAWLHSRVNHFGWFRNLNEVKRCYKLFNRVVCVSRDVKDAFIKSTGLNELPFIVQRNVIESGLIERLGHENINIDLDKDKVNLCYVGRLIPGKDPIRLLRALVDIKGKGINNWHLYFLGKGELEEDIINFAKKNKILEMVTMLGYQENPYKYVSKMDLFVCSSHSEGYSTAATEAFILQVPVLTTDCGGMKELTEGGKYGMLVPDDDGELQHGLAQMISDNNLYMRYKHLAQERSHFFEKETIVKENEALIDSVIIE